MVKKIMQTNEQKFDQVRKGAEEYYEKVGKVRCSYFNDFVHFNSEGFQHLLFKSWNRTRTRPKQYARLRLLSFAPEIIARSHTLQEYMEQRNLVRQKINSRWEQRLKLIRCYAFVAVILDKQLRIKIIVKEVEGGAKCFYSLYPSWRIAADVRGNKRKVFFAGDLETE